MSDGKSRTDRTGPEIASRLRELSSNLLWIWHPDTIAVFRDIDPGLWRRVNHNPVLFLRNIPQRNLQERAAELALDARINYVLHRLYEYVEKRDTWGHVHAGPLKLNPVAYFSAEFGLHESIPIYSGGLGTLAGDMLKAASDLNVPVVGVGLYYLDGYFNQRLDDSGWQHESYSGTKPGDMPIERVESPDGKPLLIQVETRSGPILIGLWSARVGRTKLLLLDSNVPENSPQNRELTSRLYGGDAAMRITQELILGVGGIRAMKAVGITPSALHLNEGHCAFAIFEMTRQEMIADGISFNEAFRRISLKTVFTTHTPVEAGHDRFSSELVEQNLGPLRDGLGISPEELMGLGRVNASDPAESFCMTVLGLKAAVKSNAVSALHGHISRNMWRSLWPGKRDTEIPIFHVTNGVHAASWVAPSMAQLFDRYLGQDWQDRICMPKTWSTIEAAKDEELWEVHQTIKTQLINYIQRQVRWQESLRKEKKSGTEPAVKRMRADILTVGFARRFATYKRAGLLLTNPARLEKLVTHPEHPIQVIFAGKAHPRDDAGKQVIRQIFEMTRNPRFQGRIVFIEDYDINVARHMIQGVDLWLNNPRRPLEASGTSGMKAVFNGVLNASILDGWWAEAYDGSNGFSIGANNGSHSDSSVQDERDAAALYDALENQIIPMYYEKDAKGVPRRWVGRMKNAIATLAWRFNACRMVLQYARECYLPIVGSQTDLHL